MGYRLPALMNEIGRLITSGSPQSVTVEGVEFAMEHGTYQYGSAGRRTRVVLSRIEPALDGDDALVDRIKDCAAFLNECSAGCRGAGLEVKLSVLGGEVFVAVSRRLLDTEADKKWKDGQEAWEQENEEGR